MMEPHYGSRTASVTPRHTDEKGKCHPDRHRVRQLPSAEGKPNTGRLAKAESRNSCQAM